VVKKGAIAGVAMMALTATTLLLVAGSRNGAVA